MEFGDFYDREFERVYRAAWLVAGDHHAALEATQEAFAKAWIRWRRLRAQAWVVGWVITAAVNEARDNSRRAARAQPEAVEPVREATVADLLDLRAALARVPTRRRQALILFYIGDLSIISVAEVMNTSEGTVKAHLAQGRATLRRLLEVTDG